MSGCDYSCGYMYVQTVYYYVGKVAIVELADLQLLATWRLRSSFRVFHIGFMVGKMSLGQVSE
jgi:hypothetical protein